MSGDATENNILGWERYNQMLRLASSWPEVAVGQSPKETIWSRNKARLYHYLPSNTQSQKYKTPILIIYALINKPYILDLRPGASLIEYLVKQGYDVYLLDWGKPGLEDKHLQLADYVLEYIPRAVKHVLQHANTTELTLLGYCMGGTLSVCYLALHNDAPVKNLILLAPPIDFSAPHLLRQWFDPKNFNLDAFVNDYGLIPAEAIDFGTRLLKPYQNFVQTYLSLADKLSDEQAVQSWLTMQKWVNDGVPMAGETFRQWVRDFYQGDKLATNELCLRNQRVDLSLITANLLNVVAEKDHIVPPCQSQPLMDLVSSRNKEQIILQAGHVGLVAGRDATNKLWPALNAWLASRSYGN